MSNGQRKRAEAIFQQAVELSPGQRCALLDTQCGDDATLRAEVEALLGVSDATVSSFLRSPFRASDGGCDAEETLDVPPQIGRYRILRVIGAGGMGVVYEAEQEAPHRRVALKLLRPGWLSQSLLRRFAHEEEVLGRLRHPGIAQIYEAGVVDIAGRPQPFFAMELVYGQPLTAYADEAALGTRQRLELFARVCDALQHAHQHGVIHRDLKPGNILVEAEGPGAEAQPTKVRMSRIKGGAAQPKIIDFGVARVTDGDIALTTMRTDVGQLIGTIAYMSPEQARGDSRELDTRSDVYALGVILYELLTGRLPQDVTHKPIPEAVRIITEDDPTPISSITDSAGRPLRHLRGDIETIVARALEKEKGRRYASAAELAADIRRYLADEPIVARPASTLYQLGKFARRHKALCSATAAVFLVLLAATAVSTTLYFRSERSRRESVAVRDFLKDMISSVDAAQPRPGSTTRPAPADLTVRAMLMDAKERLHQYCADQPELEAEIRDALAGAFMAVADYPEAEAQARRVIELREQRLGPEDPATLMAQSRLSQILVSKGRSGDEAESLARMSYMGLKRILGAEHADTLRSGANAARILRGCDKGEQAEALASELLPLFEHYEASAPDAATRDKLFDTHVDLLNQVAYLSSERGQFCEGEARAQDAFARCLRYYGAHHATTRTAKYSLGLVLLHQDGFGEAERLLQEVVDEMRDQYGDDHPQRLYTKRWLMLAVAHRDPQQAEDGLRQLADSFAAQFGDTHWYTWNTRTSLANVLNLERKFGEAEVLARQARDDSMRLTNDPNDAFDEARDALAIALLGQQRFTEAERTAGDLVNQVERHPRNRFQSKLPRFRNHWGQCLTELGRYEEAEQQLKPAYDGEMKMRDPRPRIIQEVIASYVRLYEQWGKPNEAAAWRAKLPATQPATVQTATTHP